MQSKKQSKPDPHVLKCDTCECKSGALETIHAVLEHGFLKAGLGSRPITREENDKNAHELGKLDDPTTNEFKLRTAAIQLNTLHHDPCHRKECFKGRHKKSCRMHYPKPCNETSSVTCNYPPDHPENGPPAPGVNVEPQRSASAIYMSPATLETLLIFMCNTNIQYVHDHMLSYYFAGYQTKTNKTNAASFATMATAFSRHYDRNKNEKGTMGDGLGRLVSCCRAHTSDEVIGAPMAGYLLLGGDTYVFSHGFERISWLQGLAFLQGEPIYTTYKTQGGAPTAAAIDYRYRPKELETKSWSEMVRCYEFIPLNRERVKKDKFLPIEGHTPEHMIVQQRKQSAVPQYVSGRTPDLRKLQKEIQPPGSPSHKHQQQQREQYAKIALIYFKPWRKLTDLKKASEGWWDAYLRHQPSFTAENQQILDHMQEHHVAFECRPVEADHDNDDSDNNATLSNDTEGAPDEADDLDTTGALYEHIAALLAGNKNKSSFAKELQDLGIAGTAATLDYRQREQMLTEQKIDSTEADTSTCTNLEGLNSFRQQTTDPINSAKSNAKQRLRQTQVELAVLTKANDSRSFYTTNLETMQTEEITGNRISIHKQAKNFDLNTEQQIAFTMYAIAILERYCVRHELNKNIVFRLRSVLGTNIDKTSNRLRLLMLGEGGTGKSHVITCVRDFAERWDMADALVICATTGGAASVINGSTWWSAMHCGPSTPDLSKVSIDNTNSWSPKGVLLCDELSMLGHEHLGKQNVRAQALKQSKDIMGGLHTSQSGDFSQLPGVKQTALYRQPKNPEAKKGQLVFDSYDSVVILEQNMRSTDPKWRKILTNARYNRLTKDDIDALNERVVNEHLVPPEGTTVAFTENVDREEYNLNVATQKIANNRENSGTIDYDSGFTIIGEFLTKPRDCPPGMLAQPYHAIIVV